MLRARAAIPNRRNRIQAFSDACSLSATLAIACGILVVLMLQVSGDPVVRNGAQPPVPATDAEVWNRSAALVGGQNIAAAIDLFRDVYGTIKDAKTREELIKRSLEAAVAIETLRLDQEGGALASAGRYQEAEPIFQKTFRIRERVFGTEYTGTAISLNNVGWSYLGEGRDSEAEPLLRQAISIREKLQGNDHIDLAAPLNILGSVLASEHRFTEAEEQLLRALMISKNANGNVHDRIVILRNLAGLYQDEGRPSESTSMKQEADALEKGSN